MLSVAFGKCDWLVRHKGDYKSAGIELVDWNDIPAAKCEVIWKKMLKGHVLNAEDFAP